MRIVVILFAWLLSWSGTAAAADSPDAVAAPAARAEIWSLYEGLRSAHYDLFAHRGETEYRAFVSAQAEAIEGPVSQQVLAITLQKIAAFGQVGHARLDAPTVNAVNALSRGGRLIPLFIEVDEGRVRLTETADRDGRFQAGAEILSVNGHPIGTWLERVSVHVSAERPYMAHTLMEQSFPILLGFELGDVDGVTVNVRNPQGAEVSGLVHAVTLAERAAIRSRFPAPSLEVDFDTRAFEILPDSIAYLRPGPFAETSNGGADPNYEVRAFAAFVDNAFTTMIDAGAADLIIDLRNNPGGDNSFSDLMVAWFADRPFRFAASFTLKASEETKAWYLARHSQVEGDEGLQAMADAEAAQPNGARYAYPLPWVQPRAGVRYAGRVHVLVNRHSFSNAASVAAMIQDYGFGRVLGEETADVPTTYASVLTFELPRTEYLVTYPKSRIVRPSGDEALQGVIPDVVIKRPEASETDLVLEAAVQSILGDRGTARRGR